MNCPNCNEVLVMSERQGVEIDYCPKCRGVWLDRGELDKIIDKSAENEVRSPGNTFREPDNYRDRHGKHGYNSHKKKRGFLGDIFDFD